MSDTVLAIIGTLFGIIGTGWGVIAGVQNKRHKLELESSSADYDIRIEAQTRALEQQQQQYESRLIEQEQRLLDKLENESNRARSMESNTRAITIMTERLNSVIDRIEEIQKSAATNADKIWVKLDAQSTQLESHDRTLFQLNQRLNHHLQIELDYGGLPHD